MEHMRTRTPRINTEVWARIQPFVEDSVAVTAPQLPYSAGQLQSRIAKYVEWVTQVKHLPLDGKIIWSRQMIDLYVTDANTHLKSGTRRNYRALLDRVSKELCPEEHPYSYTPQNRKSTVAPYTAEEMQQFREWAVGQSIPLKRRRGIAMLALCAGAGLTSSEVALIMPKQVEVTPVGIVIDVPGTNPRRVPVLPEWDSWVLALIEDWPEDQTLWGEIKRKDHSNLLSTFVENAEGKGRGPRGDRLRNTWLVWHLNNRTPMKDLFYAAGFRKMEHLPRLLAHLEFLPPEDYTQVLRGEEK
jgi:integrase